MEEGHRKDNPARQVRRARRKEPEIYRLTRSEVLAMLAVSRGNHRDKAVVHLGICAGLRSQEIRGLKGKDLARDGWIHVPSTIGKGRKERWIPVIQDMREVVDEVRLICPRDGYVVPGRRTANPPHNTEFYDANVELSQAALYKQVRRLGVRAGIAGTVTPHTLRHAFGDTVARYAGLKVAQFLMGHASVETTASTYVDKPTLDELAVSVQSFSFTQLPPDPAS
jgi:integrase/recombinase XerD